MIHLIEIETNTKIQAELMLGWLQQITFSNGDIPLVNDSAFGICLARMSCLNMD
ncbi:MAG: hypothetical protein IPL98_06840 [Saprospiraceae bacterium]|nr:hypothetical protein [Saprospiraceae bacterium]